MSMIIDYIYKSKQFIEIVNNQLQNRIKQQFLWEAQKYQVNKYSDQMYSDKIIF